MSVEWLKERNPAPCTLPRLKQDGGVTAIERSCFQEIRDLKAENVKLKKRIKRLGAS